ncbi:g2/mitotic-specific cyclin-3-related [Anaeramoeba flamelloides]|uniref:G2/mitotic-specific cyclin-3-related n=1 Tax=Anaeramoeba flamelloides TaxID=1746091 RepID=A0ABQ8XVX3_9EUKA|nr:g2/mitotic-specific cyclin-3-related [Anaeramoeba flamelloides]
MSLFYQPNTLTNIFPLNDRNKRTNNHLKQKKRAMRKRERVLRNITNQTANQFDENFDLKKRKIFKNIKQSTNPILNIKPSSKTNIVVFKEVLKSNLLRIKIKKNKKRTKAKRVIKKITIGKKNELKNKDMNKEDLTKKIEKKMEIEEKRKHQKNKSEKPKEMKKEKKRKDTLQRKKKRTKKQTKKMSIGEEEEKRITKIKTKIKTKTKPKEKEKEKKNENKNKKEKEKEEEETKKMAIEKEEEEKKITKTKTKIKTKTKPKENENGNEKEKEKKEKETNKDQEEESQEDNQTNQKIEQILDINKKYENDPLFVTEYSDEIFEYYKEKEQNFRPNAKYLDEKQPRINSKMRGILVDWLSDVCQEYKLHSETLYLAVNYIDRFLSLNCISKKHLQLLGVTALFIASKYEEVYPPTVKNFSDITENSISKKDIFKCEIKIVNALQFDLSPVTPKPFLKRYLRASQADLKTMLLANYFCEIQLIDSTYLAFLSSQIAASSVALAKMIVTKKSLTQVWDHNMVYYTKYHQNDLKPCIKKLLQSYKRIPKSKLKSAYKKYSLKELKRVSKLIIKKIVI